MGMRRLLRVAARRLAAGVFSDDVHARLTACEERQNEAAWGRDIERARENQRNVLRLLWRSSELRPFNEEDLPF